MRKRNKQLNTIIKRLNEQIIKRKNAEKKIKASLKEKEILLKEIHHRVKNNMQVISSLLSLQAKYITNNEALRILQESQDRVKSLALVHENLYRTEGLDKIDFKKYLESLIDSLYWAYNHESKNVKFEVTVDDVSLDIDSAIPFGLVVNELISNSLKHAFPSSLRRKGKININLVKTENNEVELIIQDNGIGLPKDFDFRDTDSLGLELVVLLVEKQLEGKISLEPNNGTKFRIQFNRVNV
jgi:two-component sensor histidine kinase